MRSLLFDANEINAESTNYSKFCFFIPHFFINKAIFLMYLNKYLEAGNQLVEALKIFEFGRIRQYIRLFIALVHLRMQKYDEFRIVLNRMLQDKNKSENSMIVYCSACLLASEAIISINEFSESKKYLREVIVFTKKEKILPLLASAYYFVIHTGFRLGNFTPGYKLISDFDVIINSLKCPTLDLLSSFLWNKYWVNEGNEYEIRKTLNKYCEIYQLFIENRQMAITEIGDIFNIQNINN
ncbi:hypothetical protein A3Q56_05040 [Intoshia linei]|uniref:Uncharacterized protein n=1 Tax=Intoshia linei TaxID=1819745 RepID=A0A177B0H5_9BILA|nr:hypothetical protein A3Q56_05040 [Intoshia linei]